MNRRRAARHDRNATTENSKLARAGAVGMTTTEIDFGLLAGDGIETRSAKAGEIIFSEGDEANQLFVIKSGEVSIRSGNRTLAELSSNTIFGEMALIDAAPRSATAMAKTDVELVPISEKQFLFLVSQTPYFALKVMRVLARRLRATSKSF
jgi:CRP/FNR family transcriptional regulator, cyclic AMP receptor protein